MPFKGSSWGTLGPESIGAHRRVRTLGLAAAVKAYNQAAVPGTGGLWYGKQIMLAALGIRLARDMRKRPLRMANSIEALACLLGVCESSEPDARLRGRRKLAGRTPSASYKQVSNPSFYVSTPMRMGMAEPLLALGLAFGEGGSRRFNALHLTEVGDAFLDRALADHNPNNTTVERHLALWISGATANNNSTVLCKALSPAVPLRSPELKILVEQLGKGEGAGRRNAAMAWVRNEHRSIDWVSQPAEISNDHWNDLKAGARFFALRTAALECLDAVEEQMAAREMQTLGFQNAVQYPSVAARLDDVKVKADYLLSLEQAPEGTHEANLFAATLSGGDLVARIQFLAERDGRVLVCGDADIRRGSAFEVATGESFSASQVEDPDSDPTGKIELPVGISGRVRNIALLCKDLDGTLDAWIKEPDDNFDSEAA